MKNFDIRIQCKIGLSSRLPFFRYSHVFYIFYINTKANWRRMRIPRVAVSFAYRLGTSLRATHDSKSRSHGWSSSAGATASCSLPRANVILSVVLAARSSSSRRTTILSEWLRSDNRCCPTNNKSIQTYTRDRTGKADSQIVMTMADKGRRRRWAWCTRWARRINLSHTMSRERLLSARGRGCWCTHRRRNEEREAKSVT